MAAPMWRLVFAFSTACSVASPSPRITLRIETAPLLVEPTTNDLGWQVILTSAAVDVSDLRFKVAGDAHSGGIFRWLLSEAHAHPGHLQNGTVTGTLDGDYTLRFDGGVVGDGLFIPGDYESLDFGLRRGVLRGAATKDGVTVAFDITLTAPENRLVTGVPFDEVIGSGDDGGKIALSFIVTDPFENDTLFDGIDFNAVDENLLRRTFQTHDHFLAKRQ